MDRVRRGSAALLLVVALGTVAGLQWMAGQVTAPDSAATRPTAGTPRAPAVVVLTLAPVAARGGGDTTSLRVPTSAAQVQLRLVGDLPPADALTAEVTSMDAAETSRRWPVDAAPPANDGAQASIELPAYVLPPGDYVVTVWQGDADAVLRYGFRVVP